MKLKDAFSKVIKSKQNENCVDVDDFSRELGLDIWLGWNKEFSNRVKGYFLQNWMCTDTEVGLTLYFFDDKPLAVGWKSARKNDEQFEFVSEEIAKELREFIISLKEDEFSINLCDLDSEIEDEYSVYFAGELLYNHKNGYVDGEKVNILQRIADKKDYICKTTIVEFEDGSVETVETESIKLKINVEDFQ